MILKYRPQVQLFFCFMLMTQIAIASFHKNLWPKWEAHNPLSQKVISHQKWQDFLTHRVITNNEGIHLVDYSHLTDSDLAELRSYITGMSQLNINQYNRHEQLAFWLNVYNALVVQTIADYYPINSVQEINISPGIFNVGPWGANLITIQGVQLSLDDIQNRIIRAIFNDPRTHFALNDGTLGAANLSKQAFLGKTIDQQLNQASEDYINSLRGIQVIEGKLIASKIFEWYVDDFGGGEQDLIDHLSNYAHEPLRHQLKKISSINSFTYNWHLNSTVAPTL
ncbi:MAG: DUF547 domain-containing protein [Legionellales bacterium]|nr:DUF547 domain-containing protein [Legionellales bacterium]